MIPSVRRKKVFIFLFKFTKISLDLELFSKSFEPAETIFSKEVVLTKSTSDS